jgi:hypothetical protein
VRPDRALRLPLTTPPARRTVYPPARRWRTRLRGRRCTRPPAATAQSRRAIRSARSPATPGHAPPGCRRPRVSTRYVTAPRRRFAQRPDDGAPRADTFKPMPHATASWRRPRVDVPRADASRRGPMAVPPFQCPAPTPRGDARCRRPLADTSLSTPQRPRATSGRTGLPFRHPGGIPVPRPARCVRDGRRALAPCRSAQARRDGPAAPSTCRATA